MLPLALRHLTFIEFVLLLACFQQCVAHSTFRVPSTGTGRFLLHGQSQADWGRQRQHPTDISRSSFDIFFRSSGSDGFDAADLAALELALRRFPEDLSYYPGSEKVLRAAPTAARAPLLGSWHHHRLASQISLAETKPQNSGFTGFFTSVDCDEWLLFLTAVLLLLGIDCCFLNNFDHSKTQTNLNVLAFWLAAAALYNGMVWARMGVQPGADWCSGYFLEWLLSLDNIFVFHLIFRLYNTPPKLLDKALFWGILGAVVFRVFFFMTFSTLLHLVHWFRFLFGALLIYSGIQSTREEDEDTDPTKSWPVVALKFFFGSRIDDVYDEEGGGLLVWKEGHLRATLLVPVIVCLFVTDILFAVDSVTAKVSQIPDPYICYSSSVLAMFGLRAVFFVIRDLVEYCDLLKYGLGFLLAFIGVEMILADYVILPAQVVLVVILMVFALCIAASFARKFTQERSTVASVVEAKLE